MLCSYIKRKWPGRTHTKQTSVVTSEQKSRICVGGGAYYMDKVDGAGWLFIIYNFALVIFL